MNKIPDKVKKDMACDRIGRKLVKYLETNRANGVIDFRLRIDSETHFYLHPQDKDGETLDVSWDWTKATYGNEVFGYTNKGNEFDDPESQSPNPSEMLLEALRKIKKECELGVIVTSGKYIEAVATEAITKFKQSKTVDNGR